jgi:hypothetical protein
MRKEITYEYLVKNDLILFVNHWVPSLWYSTPTSDVDKKFVYILPPDFI